MKFTTKCNRQPGKRSRNAALVRARMAKAAKMEATATIVSGAGVTPTSETPICPPNLAEVIPIRESASKRKLNLASHGSESPAANGPRYGIVDLQVVSNIVSQLQCVDCKNHLLLSCPSSHKKGFAFQLNFECGECQEKPIASEMSSTVLEDSAHFDINRRMVAAFLKLGLGFAAMSSFCETMGLPVMQEKTFSAHLNAISQKSEGFKEQILSSAISKVRSHHKTTDGEVLDIAVSFDGSWHKRGHTSKHGVAAVIEVETGLVVDYHVMSTYCQLCQTIGQQKKEEGEASYNDWLQSHQPSCTINHHGSAGLMEVGAAGILWNRSLGRQLRYTTMVSDGDCKTFSELQKNPPYDIPVLKEECTNHVAKRLGTALRNLVTDEGKKGNPLGGRKDGSLTQTKINQLQTYYKKAVASKCSSVIELQKKIMATLDHAASTDDAPRHGNCPHGDSSWCFYNRALDEGLPPPSHKKQSSVALSQHVAHYVRPIYERLTDESLLSRCLQGFTQNTNESLHSVIWAHCPKHVFVGKSRVAIATALGISNFNAGSIAFRDFLRAIGLSVGSVTFELGAKRDLKRVFHSERRETVEAKRRRLLMAQASSAARLEQHRAEGEVYAAGAF